MSYRIKGILKLPSGQPTAGVDIEFISRRNYTPLLVDLSSVIRTDSAGSYDVTLEFGEYAVVLYWGCAQPSHIGKIMVASDTAAGLDLQTLLQQDGWQPATPEYVQQIQHWLSEAGQLTGQAQAAATSAKSSEAEVEKDRAEVATNTASVASKAAEVSTKHSDVVTSAEQVATNTATVESKTTLAINAADTAAQKASEAATDAATASAAAARAETSAQAMTGALLDGGQCDLSSGAYPAALTVSGKKYSTVWYVQTGGTVDGVTFDAGDVLRYTAVTDSYFKVDAVDTATAQISAHASKASAHPISGVSGLASALADKANAVDVVPNTRKVNNKALSSDISLTAADVGAVQIKVLTAPKDFEKCVILLHQVSGGASDNRSFSGEIMANRGNGNIPQYRYSITSQKQYNSDTARITAMNLGPQREVENVYLCYCTYNGAKYVGLHFYPGDDQATNAVKASGSWYNASLQTIVYESGNPSTVVNKEVKDSIRRISNIGAPYTTVDKPTAADVGALPLTGGTLTGDLKFDSISRVLSVDSIECITKYGSGNFSILSRGYSSERNDYVLLRPAGQSASNISAGMYLQTSRNVSNVALYEGSNRVYSAANKPTAADVGAYTKAEVDALISALRTELKG